MKKDILAKSSLNVTPKVRPTSGTCEGHVHGAAHERSTILVKGEGSKELPLPTTDELLKEALKRLDELSQKAKAQPKAKRNRRRRRGKSKSPSKAGSDSLFETTGPILFVVAPGKAPKPLNPTTAAESILVAGAEGLQQAMMAREHDAISHKIFGSIQSTFALAKINLPAKYQPVVDEGNRQIPRIKERFDEALPQLEIALAQRNPAATPEQVLKAAVQMLLQQLAPFLFVFQMYSEAFNQMMDGINKKQLAVMDFIFRTSFLLFNGLDPAKDDDSTVQPKLPLKSFKIGDVYMYNFTGSGLSIVPGARGMLGVHVLNVPFEFRDVLMLTAALAGGHEFWHPLLPDIDGFEDELVATIADTLRAKHASGDLKLSAATYDVAGNPVSAIDLLIKINTDQRGEQAADLMGGGLLYGPEFTYSGLVNFPAMMVRHKAVREVGRLLRTESYFRLEQGDDPSTLDLVFGEHPIDVARFRQNAKAMAMLGFTTEAAELEALVHFAAGGMPSELTWHLQSEDVKNKVEIKIPYADINAAADIVTEIMLFHKFKALGGRSMTDMVRWTQKSQDKAIAVADALCAGSSVVPTNSGTVRATHVVSGAMMAYRRLLAPNGVVITDMAQRHKLAKDVSALAMEMLISLCGNCA